MAELLMHLNNENYETEVIDPCIFEKNKTHTHTHKIACIF